MKDLPLLMCVRLAVAAAVLLALQVNVRSNSPFPVWVISSWERAGLEDPARDEQTVKLYAARGEYESFQIVIKAPMDVLSDVNVTVSDLLGPDNQIISRANIALYREHYVHVTPSSPDQGGLNRPKGAGWYADALIPFTDPNTGLELAGKPYNAVPFDLPPGRNQPIWVDIFVPRDAAAGQYRGTATITSGLDSAKVLVTLTVWDFELPLRPSLQSSFGYWRPATKETIEELLRHKVMPQRVDPMFERQFMAQSGLSMTDTRMWSGADRTNCSMDAAPSPKQFREAAALHDPDLYIFNYTADEIGRCTNLYPSIKQWARNMHAAGINNLIVMSPVPELFDDGSGTGRSAVDIWVVLPVMYDRAADRVAQVLRKGDQVWSYNALAQDSYSPKWLIDYDPINLRLQAGFISQSLGLTGLLYWRVDRWSADPWNEVNNTGVFSAANYPGDGMLVYPGEQVGIKGVVPSIRLKQLREGAEDFEYVEILKRLGLGEWALQVSRTVAPDWTNWTRDGSALESARRQLGEQIQARTGSRNVRAQPPRQRK